MNDFRLIDTPYRREHPSKGAYERARTRVLTAEDTLGFHWTQRSWLRNKLVEAGGGHTVVITHHAPASGSVHPRYAGDALTPAFVSDLPDEFFDGQSAPVLWIHGHTHASADYRRGRCRVLANPRGYRMRAGGFENAEFDPRLVVDIASLTGALNPSPM